MKNILLYNYNIDVSEYTNLKDKGIVFYIDYQKYYFIKTNRTVEDIKVINSLLQERPNKFHKFILNNKNEPVTVEDKTNYVLLQINGSENSIIDFKDIANSEFIVSKNSILNRNDWGTLWSEKVDYLEYQMSELGKGHNIAIKSFSYYIGLAENAIEYFNMITISNAPLAIARKRIYIPSIASNFYNPLNIIVDYRVRDLAEYIKIEFFAGKKEEVKKIIQDITNKRILTESEYHLFYIRLLYPSYYFDILTDVLENEKNEDEMLKYIEQTNEYEEFLKYTYESFRKVSSIFKIEWLVNKKKS